MFCNYERFWGGFELVYLFEKSLFACVSGIETCGSQNLTHAVDLLFPRSTICPSDSIYVFIF